MPIAAKIVKAILISIAPVNILPPAKSVPEPSIQALVKAGSLVLTNNAIVINVKGRR